MLQVTADERDAYGFSADAPRSASRPPQRAVLISALQLTRRRQLACALDYNGSVSRLALDSNVISLDDIQGAQETRHRSAHGTYRKVYELVTLERDARR